MTNYGLFGKFTTAPENRDALIDILTQASKLMEGAEGCHSYIVSKDNNDATATWVLELWTSEEAHDASLSIEGVRELIAQAMPLLTDAPMGVSVLPIAGKGLIAC